MCASVAAKAQHSNVKGSEMTAEIMQYVNEYRAQKGLGPLRFDPVIAEGATIHSRDMACRKVPFGHEGFERRMGEITSRVKPAMGCAENVAYGSVNAKEVVNMWLNSPGHKKNIEGNYNLSGIGVVKGPDGALYFTQIFVNKKG